MTRVQQHVAKYRAAQDERLPKENFDQFSDAALEWANNKYLKLQSKLYNDKTEKAEKRENI